MLRARRQTPKAQACQLFANSSLMHGDAEALFDLAFQINAPPAHNPAKGKGAGLVMPWCDTDAMAAHLIEISAAVDPGAHAVLIVDQAGWHLTPKLAIPDNITVLALPPRSPELNPVENVWQFMRDNWLSNRIFKSYEDIVALCCQAWNNLIDQPWKIMSLGMRKWAHGF